MSFYPTGEMKCNPTDRRCCLRLPLQLAGLWAQNPHAAAAERAAAVGQRHVDVQQDLLVMT
jgi:hypothetical protein